MKNVLAILCAVAITGGVAYAIASKQKANAFATLLAGKEAAWQQEKDKLEADLQAARKQAGPLAPLATKIEYVETGAPAASPEEIIEKLRGMRASSRDARSIRRVIHHLEQLHDIGEPAVPAIRAFLNKFEDVDYYSVRQQETNPEEQRGDRGRGGRGDEGNRDRDNRPRFDPRGLNGRLDDVRLTFTTPPSLRLGLIDVLQNIGGAAAEETLAEVLATTGRAVELAYVTKTLQEMAPNKYAVTAVTAAKDLLLDPPQMANGDRLDENSKDYLYHVLMMYNDTSFASNAQTLLVGMDGRIDRHALNYLRATLKDQAMPAIQQAFSDPRITNQWERASLMTYALNYAGPNQQANQMLNSVISNESIPSQMRAMSLMALTRGQPDAETIKARLPLIEALKGSTTDERLQRTLDFTYMNLQNMLQGKPPEDNWRAMFDRGGGGGNRRPGQTPQQQNTPRQGRPATR